MGFARIMRRRKVWWRRGTPFYQRTRWSRLLELNYAGGLNAAKAIRDRHAKDESWASTR